MKVFRITGSEGEELVAASTLLLAIAVYCDECGVGIEDFTENDSIEEVLPGEWDRILINESTPHLYVAGPRTLAEVMLDITEPELITTLN